jgi:hypothetical protein
MTKDWEEVQMKFVEAQKPIEDAAEKDAETGFEMAMAMLRKFHIKALSGSKYQVSWPVIFLIGGNGRRQPPSASLPVPANPEIPTP